MIEVHTADLAARSRYRQEGAEAERERIIKLLENDGYMIEWDKNHAIKLITGQWDNETDSTLTKEQS